MVLRHRKQIPELPLPWIIAIGSYVCNCLDFVSVSVSVIVKFNVWSYVIYNVKLLISVYSFNIRCGYAECRVLLLPIIVN